MNQHIPTPGQSSTPQPAPDPWLARAVARQKRAQRTTRTPSDEEILAWYRTFAADNPRRAPLTERQRQQYLRHRADIEKPRDKWTLMDVARYFATSIEIRKPHLIGRPNVKQLHGALAAWQLDHGIEQDEIVQVMDKYLNDSKALSQLDRDPRPIEHFLQYFKQQPRKVTATHSHWVSGEPADVRVVADDS
jgi:hypothetical protein